MSLQLEPFVRSGDAARSVLEYGPMKASKSLAILLIPHHNYSRANTHHSGHTPLIHQVILVILLTTMHVKTSRHNILMRYKVK